MPVYYKGSDLCVIVVFTEFYGILREIKLQKCQFSAFLIGVSVWIAMYTTGN